MAPAEEFRIRQIVQDRLLSGNFAQGLEGPEEVLILHNEPSILERERLLVGQTLEDKPPLLHDYLRLFAKVSGDVVRAQTGPIIERALENLLSAPDEAQQELESLVEAFDVPNAARQLLRVYRLRNVAAPKIMSMAERLWQHHDIADDELLFDVVRHNFKPIGSYQKSHVSLDFVEDVWRKFTPDLHLGLALSKSFSAGKMSGRALAVAHATWVQHAASNEAFANYLVILRDGGKISDALLLIEDNRNRVMESALLVELWADLIIADERKSPVPEELMIGVGRQYLEHSKNVVLLGRLLQRAGRLDEAVSRATDALSVAIRARDLGAMQAAANIFMESHEEESLRRVIHAEIAPTYSEHAFYALRTGNAYTIDYGALDKAAVRR